METKKTTPSGDHHSSLRYAKYSIYALIIIGVGRLISYSLEQYKLQDGENIFICDETECFQTTHMHADISFDLCGANPSLSKETGPLDGLHTHKEKNYLHFHSKVSIDRERFDATGEKIWEYEKSLSIQEIIEIFELKPEKYCGTSEVTVIATVNGEETDLNHNRKDGEKVHITYSVQ